MHAQPTRTLKRLLKTYGQELIDDPRRTEALLRDHCGQHTREIFVLVNAQKQRVPNELRAAPAWMPRQATYSRLSRLLQTKLALTEDAADWAVVAWASALDLDSPPKGDAWSWLPGQSRAPASSGKKSRSKKRQNPASTVQSSKKSNQRAKARAARAEMRWGLPAFDFSRIRQLFAAPQLFTGPIVWANILPWVALITATLFLLTVVYWTSNIRNQLGGDSGAVIPDPSANQTPGVAASNETLNPAGDGVSSKPMSTIGTPLPELPELPSHYVNSVLPAPTWANVNVGGGPLLIRETPSTDAPFLSVLQDGDPVSVVAYSDDGRWSQINSPRAGWVSNDFLLFISADAPYSPVRVNVQLLAARHDSRVLAAPLADAAEVATLQRDDLVVVAAAIGQPPEWYQIADPAIGWVAASELASPSP